MMEIWLEILIKRCSYDRVEHAVMYHQFYFIEMKSLAKDCLILGIIDTKTAPAGLARL